MTGNMTNPAVASAIVAQSDDPATDKSGLFRSLWVGTGGNVEVVHKVGQAGVVYTNVADGTILPVQGVRVGATLTTASNIVAMK